MRKLVTAMIMTALAQAAWAGDPGVEILMPPSHVGTARSFLHVVGKTGAPAVEVLLNGEHVRTVTVTDSLFHAGVSFGYGLNVISVFAVPAGGKDVVSSGDTIEVMSAPMISRDYRKMFESYTFHGKTVRRECSSCHAKSGTGDSSDETSEWCYTCHGSMEKNFRSHIAKDDRACAVCHTIDPDMTLAVSGEYSGKNPCYSCHTDKIGQFARDYIHGPVAGGTCTVCHDPHGSVFDHSLISPVSVLCASCHPMEEASARKTQHKPFADGRCNLCHDPHSTNNRWVLTRQSEELCLSCHEKNGTLDGHRHPYDVKPTTSTGRSMELTEKGLLECLSCHEPHSTDTPHLLRTSGENTCGGCHKDR